jgi:hypothetical protein
MKRGVAGGRGGGRRRRRRRRKQRNTCRTEMNRKGMNT